MCCIHVNIHCLCLGLHLHIKRKPILTLHYTLALQMHGVTLTYS